MTQQNGAQICSIDIGGGSSSSNIISSSSNNNNDLGNHDEDVDEHIFNNNENQPLDSTDKHDSKQLKQISSSQPDSEMEEARNENQETNKHQHGVTTTTPTTTKRTRNQIKVESKYSQNHQANIEPSLLLTATDYKNAGNKLCSLYRYEEALAYYSKAISKNPQVAIFFSNRALCHLKLQQFNEACQDCRRALELDPNLIKSHFFLGQALAETNNFDDSLKHLQRAHELAREKKMNFGDDIAYQIRLTKRRRWNKIEDDTAQLEDGLQKYLVELIEKDKQAKLGQLKDRLRTSGPNDSPPSPTPAPSTTWQPTASCSSLQTTSSPPRTTVTTTIDTIQESEIISKCDKYIDKLNSMFNHLKLQRTGRDVPDYLCGKISFEIMHDPVITPSGITYDRQDIEEHLKRVGHFDPITRQALEANQLISNLAMKEVVDAYLNENEWALYH